VFPAPELVCSNIYMVGAPCFLTEICGATAKLPSHKKNMSAPMNTPSRSRITRSTPPASRPPELPPLGNNEGSDPVASECVDSDEGGSGDVDAFVDDFLASLPTHADGGEGGLLDQFGLADDADQSPALNRNLFEDGNVETPTRGRAALNEAAAALTDLASFPSSFGTTPNRFTNQNSELNDEGYDSEGNLPYFADANLNDDMDEYVEESIDVGGGEAPPAAGGEPEPEATAPVPPIDVMGLTVAALKEELKKRGRTTGGNKAALQERLREAIVMNVPVMEESSGANESRRPD
jgi:hypothetical protein